ncbi:MAG TPA: hypothetical protein VHE55_14630 [Fimbriimonadaceae bacterium]|nr:hypothetical protein [Fimbriimonadaceae bacterium]
MLALIAAAVVGLKNPLADPNTFPIAVWLQDPSQAQKYKAAGINLYVGLWQGPTEDQLAKLRAAEMPVICDQNEVGLKHKSDPVIVGWMHQDEPDNAQEVTDASGHKGYGPCVPPQTIVDRYRKMKAADPSHPVMLNLGQGVANDQWIGRGNGAKLDDYKTYVRGGDIVSFDIYPVAGLEDPGKLPLIGKGLDRLQGWTDGKKRIWNCLECTAISGKAKATSEQVEAEAWSSIIHGSRGFIYFVHQFQPRFDEHALLDDPAMLASVAKLNRRIQELAPALNQGSKVPLHLTSQSVDGAAIRYENALYVFVANPSAQSAALDAEAPEVRPNRSGRDIESGGPVVLVGGRLKLTVGPFGHRLLRFDLRRP